MEVVGAVILPDTAATGALTASQLVRYAAEWRHDLMPVMHVSHVAGQAEHCGG